MAEPLAQMQDETVSQLVSITNCDAEFARSFLAANDWNLETAVNQMVGGGGDAGLGGAGGMGGMFGGGGGSPGIPPLSAPEEVRAPMPQVRETLIDPAERMPRRAPPPAAPANHPLDAFRDTSGEGNADGEGDASDAASVPREVFGLPKKPKNLAEMYRQPTELTFAGAALHRAPARPRTRCPRAPAPRRHVRGAPRGGARPGPLAPRQHPVTHRVRLAAAQRRHVARRDAYADHRRQARGSVARTGAGACVTHARPMRGAASSSGSSTTTRPRGRPTSGSTSRTTRRCRTSAWSTR